MTDLCDFEMDVLRRMDGRPSSIKGWSPRLGAAIESLHNGGYISRKVRDGGREVAYSITDKGRSAIPETPND